MPAAVESSIVLPAAPGYIYPHVAQSGGGATDAGQWLADIDPMSIAWDASKRPGLQALLNNLKDDTTTPQWTHADLREWMDSDRRYSEDVMETRLRQLRYMESYPHQPVMTHGTLYQFLMTARLYLAVREERFENKLPDGGSPAAIGLDLKVLRNVGDFLGLPKNVWPVRPPTPQVITQVMQRPERVREMLHAHYAPDYKRSGALEDAWVRHVLAFMYGQGPRPPKELWVMEVSSWIPAANLQKIVEPKKHYRERLNYVEPEWLGKSHSRPSTDTWVTLWLPRLRAETGYAGTRMFPNPVTGRDFPSAVALGRFLTDRVKPLFPEFHPYLARHWSVYARLIGSDGKLSDTRYNQVAEWHGHESVDMTRDTYGPHARAYAKAYGANWLSRAFAKPRTDKEA
jgi:hypothetical protein